MSSPPKRAALNAMSWPQITARLAQTAKSVRADDDVVNYVNTQQLAGFDQGPRHIDILVARSQRSSRMIVRNDDRMRISQQSSFEDLAWMYQTRGYSAVRNNVISGTPDDLEQFVAPLKFYSEEHFVAFHLDAKNQVIG